LRHVRTRRTVPLRHLAAAVSQIRHANLSQKEVARLLGVTEPAVHQVEKRALRKLREGLLSFPDVRELLEESAA
jgi:DNA-directed RNA polymerase specialized sigma subunit